MDILTSISSAWDMTKTEKRAEKRLAMLRQTAAKYVNVTEYEGVVYFAYRGVPLIPVDYLKCGITEALPKVRETVVRWVNTADNNAW